MVFERNDGTGVSTTRQSAPDSPYGSWTDLGGTIVDYPAATTDATGAAVLFVVGTETGGATSVGRSVRAAAAPLAPGSRSAKRVPWWPVPRWWNRPPGPAGGPPTLPTSD